MPNPVVHFDISARDGAKVREFYGKLFDWKINFMSEMNDAPVKTKGNDGGIDGGIALGNGHTGVSIFVQVPNHQASLDKAESLGGKTVMPPTEIPGVVTMATLKAVEGNLVGLVKG
ncbi:MAG TPA: glyoxalase [Chloroflexota bacterium]|nr:glyoxalase [Chloroflexota bacterium]